MAATDAVQKSDVCAEICTSVISAQALELTLYVAASLCYFDGHFPDFPILPGVVQLNWVVQYAREFLAMRAPVMRVERLKFTSPIQPDMQVNLSMDVDTHKKTLNFTYSSVGSASPIVFSQGRLVYE